MQPAQPAQPAGGAGSQAGGSGGGTAGAGGAVGGAGAGGAVGGGGGAGRGGGAAGTVGAGGAGGTGGATSTGTPTIFYLDVAGRVMTADAENPNPRVLVAEAGQGPDGIAIDLSPATSSGRAWAILPPPTASCMRSTSTVRTSSR